MARTVGVSIVLTAATEGAKTALSAAARVVRGLGAAADGAKSGLGWLIKAPFRALSTINAGLELAQKAMGAFQATIGAAIAKSIEHRASNDALRKEYQATSAQVERLAGLLGDILVPIMLAVTDAFGSASESAEGYLAANRAIIGSRIVDVLATMAKIVTSGLATGFLIASKAVAGLREILVLLWGASREAFGAMLKGLAGVLGAAAAASHAIGKEGMAQSLLDAAAASREFGEAQAGSWDRASASAAALVRDQKQLEEGIDKAVVSISQGIGRFAVGAYARLGVEVRKTKQLTDEQRAAVEAAAKAEAAWQQRRASMLAEHTRDELAANAEIMARTRADIAAQEAERIASLERQRDAAIAAQEAQTQSATDFGLRAQSAFQGVADSLSVAIANGENFGSVMRKALIQTITLAARAALVEVAIEQVKAAARAFSAHAGIPFVGALIGAAAATASAAAVGAIGARLGSVGGLAQGGRVPGSGLGDRVVAVLEPGEAVIPRAQTSTYLDEVARRTAQQQPARGGGSQVVVMQTVVPASRRQVRESMLGVVAPEMRMRHRLQ